MSAAPSVGVMVRRLALALVVACVVATAGRAHPGPGIVVGPDGRVYFVLFGPNRIMVLEPDGRVTVFAEDDRWVRLHHLVLDSAGNLFTTSDHDGRVWRIAPDGRVSEFFVSPRPWNEHGITIGGGGDPFTLDAEGNVYALDRPGGSNVRRILPTGDVLGFAELGGAGARIQGLHFSSMAWGPDGHLYVSDATRVWRIAPGGEAVRLDLGGERLEMATGLAVHPDGSVFVADYRGRRVLMVRRGGEAAVVAPGTGWLRLRGPVGVALGPDNALYLTDHGRGVMAVWRVTSDGPDRVYVRNDPGVVAPWLVIGLLVLAVALNTWQRQSTGVFDWLWWTVFAGVVVGGFWAVARDGPILGFGRHILVLVYVAGAVISYRRRKTRQETPPTAI